MSRKTRNAFSIFLNVILIVFLTLYFLVAFLNYPVLAKVFSPLCGLVSAFQGPDYAPTWCSKLGETKVVASNTNKIVNNNDNKNNNANNNANTNSTAQIVNPASVKCLADGGKLETYDSLIGQFSLCVFTDNSICDEWAYFRGECKIGQCVKQCEQANSALEGWYNSCSKELIKLEKCSTLITQPVGEASIILTSPVANQQLSSPIVVSGRARVFENQVSVRVKSKSGQVLITEKTVAKAPAVGQWGDFSLSVNYQFSTTKEGLVEVYSLSAKDGNEENLVSIPVKF